jgi:thiosulfate reductase cytochrome b subunit
MSETLIEPRTERTRPIVDTSAKVPSIEIREKHSLAIRWLHWINFPLLTILLWSGLLIYWANDTHEIHIFDYVIHFFPDGFYKALHVPFLLADGLQFHLTFSWLFTINGFFYVLYLALRGGWRDIVPRRGALRDAIYVLLHDLHLRKTAPVSDGYNAAQRIAYSVVVLMGFLAVATGLAIAKSARFGFLTSLFGGYRTAKLIHFVLALSFVAFFAVHVVQVLLAGWNNFRSMIVGSELIRNTTKRESR